jgi:two-component system, chemotaxis family, CheB/CheR fusion protein
MKDLPESTLPIAFPVVGVGASPAGLDALTSFLRHVPADTGMAFVCVPGIAASLLAGSTAMPVVEGLQNTRVERNHVYVIPPHTLMSIDGAVLKQEPARSRKPRPINHFLRSLARGQKSLALGVVLSGGDDDGAAGLQAIRAEGGVTITAGNRGTVPSPEEIGAELTRIGRDIELTNAGRTDHAFIDFFRDERVLRELEKSLPALLRSHAANTPFRIWVPGCATGQEVYAIAMCVIEAMLQHDAPVPVQIFGTDVSERVLAIARHAVYPECGIAGISPERRSRFFVRLEDGFQIAKSIRELCVFARQNPLIDPPFSRLNLISCHNLNIDPDPDRQRQTIGIFDYALQPDGCILPGEMEKLNDFPKSFARIDQSHKLYRRNPREPGNLQVFRPGGVQAGQEFPFHVRESGRAEQAAALVLHKVAERTAERIVLVEYGPVWALVNDDFEVVTTRGDTSAYLEVGSGDFSRAILRLARPELRADLGSLLGKARRGETSAASIALHRDANGSTCATQLEVRRIAIAPGAAAHYLVVFKPGNAAPELEKAPREHSRKHPSGTMEQLRKQIVLANRRLETILTELDAANVELTAANDEIHSSNDELRRANEELQTSEEELQSSNEELNAVNHELQNRNRELARLGDDLENLLSSTTIPILMLDNDLRIKRITPAAEKSFNVRPIDMGRSVCELRLRLSAPNLHALIRRVIDTSTGDEIELQDREDRWHVLRVRPYRTADNRMEGAVLAMIDIDQLRRAQKAAEMARQFAESVIEAVQTPLLVLRGDLRVRSANHAFLAAYGLQAADVESRTLADIGGAQWRLPALHIALQRILRNETGSEYLECEQDIQKAGRRNVLIHARRIRQEGENEILVAIQDVTAQKHAEHVMIDEQERLKRSVRLTAEELQQTETALHESEDALRRSRGDLRALTASLLNAHEQERRRVSRELHDDVSQNMAKLQFDIETLEQALPAGLSEEKRRLLLIRDSAGQLSNDLRRIAYALHPSALDHLGLTVALRAYGREFSKRTRIPVKFITARVPAKVPQEISSSFYRITQEALRNVLKHSSAGSVCIRLTGGNNNLTLVIRDNGPGFEREAIRGKNGLGLISMEERARLISGTFQLETRPGHGVSITVSAPLN